MIERAIRGSPRYHLWLLFLLSLSSLALFLFSRQLREGLTITAMSQNVPWGFYIAQLTFLVGVAASAVMVVLPYYLHDFKVFGKITILGEFLAVPAVLLCPLFVAVDLGQPSRVMNIFFHPQLNSMLFWDTVALGGYLVLNLVIGWQTLEAERREVPPARWVRPLILLSIPWAVSIHTVTAFLYAGLPARPFWFTAVLAPRFLASAFASGPSLLILLAFVVRRVSRFDPGDEAIRKLAVIVTYAMALNLFLFGAELFTVLYSGMEHHTVHLQYLFVGVEGQRSPIAPFMWLSMALGVSATLLLLVPRIRTDFRVLPFICGMVFVAVWLDKGAGMLTGGFVPSPMGAITRYFPSLTEIFVGVGLYAFGALVLTMLYKMVLSVRGEGAWPEIEVE
ncbi:MAG: polysulfide reductase NrfD [Gemmatimonadetes bacterium]|nr:polysulfide reductase NrfD [Gemmatimonadota bacterium]NNM07366.1 polysulfide reductase NrfD [Gemmatimonadota bacterium]